MHEASNSDPAIQYKVRLQRIVYYFGEYCNIAWKCNYFFEEAAKRGETRIEIFLNAILNRIAAQIEYF